MNKKEIKAPAFKFEMVDGIYQRVGMFDNIIAELRCGFDVAQETAALAANTIETLQARVEAIEEIHEDTLKHSAHLLARFNNSQARVALQDKEIRTLGNAGVNLLDRAEAAEARVKAMAEALEFYVQDRFEYEDGGSVEEDKGDKARAALKEG